MEEQQNPGYESRAAGRVIQPYTSYAAAARRRSRNSFPGSSNPQQWPRTVDQPLVMQDGAPIRTEPIRVLEAGGTLNVSDKSASSSTTTESSAELIERLRLATSPNASSRSSTTSASSFFSSGSKSATFNMFQRFKNVTSAGSSSTVVQEPKFQSPKPARPGPSTASSSSTQTQTRHNVNAPQRNVRFTLGPADSTSQLPKAKEPTQTAPQQQQQTRAIDPKIEADFLEPEVIPKTKPPIFVYPHSGTKITSSFQERFREVVDMFRQNTESHVLLASCVQYIDYTLRLCGTSAEEAHPSILVFCRSQDFSPLRALLTSRELGAQYLRRKPRGDLLSRWRQGASEVPPAAVSSYADRPLFNLYFWRSIRPRTLLGPGKEPKLDALYALKGTREEVVVYPRDSYNSRTMSRILQTLPGAAIRTGKDRTKSTLGCVITLNEELYAVTTRHSLGSKAAPKIPPLKVPTTNAISTPKSSRRVSRAFAISDGMWEDLLDDDDYDFEIDDVEYETMSDDNSEPEEPGRQEDPFKFQKSPAKFDKASMTEQPIELRLPQKRAVFVPRQDDLIDGDSYDYDWALVNVTGLESARQGRWRSNDSAIGYSDTPTHLPRFPTHVLILTDKAKPQNGVLQPELSMLGGINGSAKSVVWTVKLPGKNSLSLGDSGAVVVDAAKRDVCGLVIGSNPLGEVYISPFYQIMRQIQFCFPDFAIFGPCRPFVPKMSDDEVFIRTKTFCSQYEVYRGSLPNSSAISPAAMSRRSRLRRRYVDHDSRRPPPQSPVSFNTAYMGPQFQPPAAQSVYINAGYEPLQMGLFTVTPPQSVNASYGYPYPYPPTGMMPPSLSTPYPMAVAEAYQQSFSSMGPPSATNMSTLYTSNMASPMSYTPYMTMNAPPTQVPIPAHGSARPMNARSEQYESVAPTSRDKKSSERAYEY